MTEHQEAHDRTANMVRDHYNPPPATPRDEIWSALEARIHAAGSPGSTPREQLPVEGPAGDVIPMEGRRKRKWGAGRWGGPWGVAWVAAAATVVLAAGIGVGRWSRGPVAPVESGPVAQAPEGGTPLRAAAASRLAAAEHLARTEPLLTLVKGDVARGSVDPAVAEWARDLLGQTRFLLDSGLPLDPEVVALLEDLEMVLLQATLVAGGEVEGDRARQELEILGEGMEDRNVLSRIQALVPGSGVGLAGS